MAEAEFVSGNYTAAEHTPSGADIAAGEVITVVDTNWIAHRAIEDGELGALATRGGIYRVTKDATVAMTKGDRVYWDATNNNLDKTNTNKPFGYAAETVAADATTVLAEHNP